MNRRQRRSLQVIPQTPPFAIVYGSFIAATGILCYSLNENKTTKELYMMKTKQDLIKYCLTYPQVYEDYPFHDPEWAVIRHRENRKVFAWIYRRNGQVCVNVKCEPQWIEFWRNAYPGVLPG